MSTDDHARTAPAHRHGHLLRNVLLVLLALLLVLALLVSLFLWNLGRTFDQRKQVIAQAFPEESTRPAASSAQDRGTTVLLLGSDQRDERAGADGARADAIMLVHVPEDGGEVYVMSILRDTWVEIPGHGPGKINSALDLGGPALLVETVEELFGVRVDEVVEADFAGFRGLTDALGGVTIDVPKDFVSWENDIPFEEGPMHMDGATALEFVRERHAFEGGDYQRVTNQRAYVEAVLEKLISAQTLSRPGRIQEAVSEISPYLEVSEGLDAGWVAGLAPELAGLSPSDIEMFTVPTEGIGASPDGQSVVLPDLEAMEEIGVATSADKLDEYVATLSPDDQ